MTSSQAFDILLSLGHNHERGAEPSHIPTSIQALTSYLNLRPSAIWRPGGLLSREREILGRKQKEYLFQALFNMPARCLSGVDDYMLMDVREVVVTFRLQLQLFLRQAFAKYRIIEATLSTEEKLCLTTRLQEMGAQEQRYQQKEDKFKAKILELWQDHTVYRLWHHVQEDREQEEREPEGFAWGEEQYDSERGWGGVGDPEHEWEDSNDDFSIMDEEPRISRTNQIAQLLLDISLDTIPQEDRSCGICWEPYLGAETPEDSCGPGEDPAQLPCKHILGKTCVSTWLKKESTCCVCRRNFFNEDIEDNNDDNNTDNHNDVGYEDSDVEDEDWPEHLSAWLVTQHQRDDAIWEREPAEDLEDFGQSLGQWSQDLDVPDQDPEINCFAAFSNLSVFCTIPKL
jgi:hypothetical protein